MDSLKKDKSSRKYKSIAGYRNYIFDLTKDEFRELTKNNCYYCGQFPKSLHTARNAFGSYVYNGIDRVNNNIGYNRENCVTCCGICNRAKNDSSIEEFKTWIKNLIQYQKVAS